MKKLKKFLDLSGLVINTAFSTKIGKCKNEFLIRLKILLLINLINFQLKYLMKNWKIKISSKYKSYWWLLIKSVNPLCLIINKINGYVEKKAMKIKYLTLAPDDESKDRLKKY